MSEEPVSAKCPKTVRANRTIGDTVYLGGVGDRQKARVMFLSPAALEEECSAVQREAFGRETKVKPSHLKGPAGTIFSELAASCGLFMDECFYTSICRWLLPKARRMKPSKSDFNEGMDALRTDILEIKPDIIVCLGKAAFDQLVDIKVTLNDVAGAWFRSKEFGCLVYPMDSITKLVSKPEYIERFKMDLKEVRRMLAKLDGNHADEIETNYRVIHDSTELRELIEYLRLHEHDVLSVDCEWHGHNHVDGSLRSLQICWAPGQAAYIRFMDDKMNYAFDVPYIEAGRIMSSYLDEPDVKYVGHHISADLPWMHTVLGLQWYNKALLDTEFAQQTEDEHMELGLERLGMLYTDLGRYDLALTLWTKQNSKLVQDGYGFVPDEILIPYACRDVDAVMRAYPAILKRLASQGLIDYYFRIFNPFVTNVFTNFAIQGLPINEAQLTELRELYHYVRDELEIEFRRDVRNEADSLLLKCCLQHDNPQAFVDIRRLIDGGETDEALSIFKKMVGARGLAEHKPVFDHYMISGMFNIRSPEQMKRWLFEVKKYEPIKSTNNREKGMPSMDWAKIKELEPHRRAEYSPSADKQTLEILAASHNDSMLKKLLKLNAVGNICKAFLKKGHVDDTGEVDREAGLHFFLAADGRVHGQTSATETGRPRSWKPNSLNWPSWVNKTVAQGMSDVLVARHEEGSLPPEFNKYIKRDEKNTQYNLQNPDKPRKPELEAKVPSIRSCVQAPEGWCMVESDYQTAEIRGLAFISEDEDLIRIITEPDPCFAKVRPEFMVDEDCVCRLDFPDELKGVSDDIKKSVVMTYTVDGECLARFTPEQLLRDANGSIVHSKADLHWSLAEMVHGKPREILNKKRDRGAAKVGNFSSAYGASPDTIERKIESDTGIKPEPGQGQDILDALGRRQPKATAFLENVANSPVSPGYLVAASGRVRHFYTHSDNIPGIGRQAKSVASAMGREARNFFMQESVAATAAIAGAELLEFGRQHRLQGKPMTILYDSVVTLCPIEEREIWVKAHELFMFRATGWRYGDRILQYPIDTEINISWSSKPPKDVKEKLLDFSQNTVSNDKLYVLKLLDLQLDIYRADVKLSTRNSRNKA